MHSLDWAAVILTYMQTNNFCHLSTLFKISVKSMFQTELENMMGKSGLKLKLDAPQAIVDDPTLEVKRLEAFVSTVLCF